MQLRYFIGVTLTDDLSQIIAQLQRKYFIPGKVMEPLVPHITLLHPDILQTLAPSFFIPKIKQAADKQIPVAINLEATDLFDKRVLYIKAESTELEKLHQELSGLIPEKVRAQYEVSRKFIPHVTLAQAKPKQNLPPELIKKFKKEIDPLLPHTFTINNLTKFTWTRPRTYTVEKI